MKNRNQNGAEPLPEQAFHSPRARFEFTGAAGMARTAAVTSGFRNPPANPALETQNRARTKRELIVFWLFLSLILVLSGFAFWLLWAKIHGRF